MTITYEWDIEEVDRESGDILDHNHGSSLAWLIPNAGAIIHQGRGDLVLVRNEGNNLDGLIDRCWAYAQGYELPQYFSASDGSETDIKVPQRFHREIKRHRGDI